MRQTSPLQAELPLWPSNGLPPGATLLGGAPAQAGESLHRALLAGEWVPYRLRRAPRRRLALIVDADGLRVSAAMGTPQHAIDALLAEHALWVNKKLRAWQTRPRRPEITLSEGTRVPYRGHDIQVNLLPAGGDVRWQDERLVLGGGRSRVGDTSPPALLERALRARAREVFLPRLEHFVAELSALLGHTVPVPTLSISGARTRWGSCSLRTGIRLNWRLLHFSDVVSDYVIAHEVAHLKHMNHAPRFWAVVAALCPDYRANRGALREAAERLPIYR